MILTFKRSYLILFFWIIVSDSFAQAPNLSGTILDAETKTPIESVSVSIPELEKYCFSNEYGSFIIPDLAQGEFKIVFSRLGYKRNIETIRFSTDTTVKIIIEMLPEGYSTPSVVVKGNRYSSDFLEASEHSKNLEGKQLQQKLGQTLASTLKDQTGLAVRSMGPAPARPVIRGLGGDRVMIAEDGIKTNDLSATSPDHAVSIEPFTAEKIEIIRGPKVLLYQPTAIGGVVNAQKNDISLNVPDRIRSNIASFYESANSGYLTAGDISIPYNEFVARGELSYRESQNLRSPVRTLKNTSSETINTSGGLSYVSERAMFGTSVSQFSSDYGIPGGFVGGHPNGVNIEMLRRNYNFKSIIDIHSDPIDNISFSYSRTYYKHIEFETADLIGAEFVIREHIATAEIGLDPSGYMIEGTAGLFLDHRDIQFGGFVFTPNTSSLDLSGYIYNEFQLDDLSVQTGARYTFRRHDPENDGEITRIGTIRRREFHSLSASVTSALKLFKEHFIGFNISWSSRPPTIEELFSEGPHLAAYSFEVGNPQLALEQGLGTEVFFYKYSEKMYGSINLFANIMDSYIVPRNTGDTNYSQLLPIFERQGVPALLTGAEAELGITLFDHLVFDLGMSYTYGEITHDNSPLPMIPPFRSNIELTYKRINYNFGVNAELASAQKRTDQFELPTESYIIFGLFGQFMFYIDEVIASSSLSIDNIFDRVYFNHLSRIKSIMPEPGFNIRFALKVHV